MVAHNAYDWLKARETALRTLEAARTQAKAALAGDPSLSGTFGEQVARLRMLGSHGSSRNPKALVRLLAAATGEARWLLALLGPGEGIARAVMEFLPDFHLDPGQRHLAAMACAETDPERALEFLEQAGLEGPAALLEVLLVALAHQPVLDFEEQRKIEVLFQSGDTERGPDLRRRYEQARARAQAHASHHQLRFVPAAIRQVPAGFFKVLHAMLRHDPYGSLECLRTLAPSGPLKGMPQDRRLDLLDVAASWGLGLASNYLDLFELEDDPETRTRLRAIFIADLTAGSSIYGACALEGVQNYPFGLRRIEPQLPRRISNAEALAFLKKDDPESVMPKTYNPNEVGNAVTLLQDREVQRFLEQLSADIFLGWKELYSENKRAVLFGDLELRIRNILFLIAHATFRDNAYFDDLLANLAATHPSTEGNPAHLNLLANRYFFLEVLGINPSLLFNGQQRGAGAQRAPIEEVKNFRVQYLLHVAMSIHLHVGETLFRNVPIAWTILQKQGDGLLDSAVQEVLGLFDTFDTLLVLGRPLVPDLREWLMQILEALSEGDRQVPVDPPAPCPASSLRLVTRDAIARHRETLNDYCLQVLRLSAARSRTSVTSVIQNLRLPRTKTDKLFALLEEERRRSQVRT